jgi:hypothetical protein
MKNEIGLWVFQCRLVNRSTYNGASMNVGVYVDDVCADFSPLRRQAAKDSLRSKLILAQA